LKYFCNFNRIFWIASPDMCKEMARFRRGDEFVESGSLIHHREAYAQSLHAALGSSGGVQIVFLPTTALCEASGFSKDIYATHKHP
jgi:nicotinic acid mononucleotide adenylyltransferase